MVFSFVNAWNMRCIYIDKKYPLWYLGETMPFFCLASLSPMCFLWHPYDTLKNNRYIYIKLYSTVLNPWIQIRRYGTLFRKLLKRPEMPIHRQWIFLIQFPSQYTYQYSLMTPKKSRTVLFLSHLFAYVFLMIPYNIKYIQLYNTFRIKEYK